MTNARRPAGRPSKPLLTQESIVDAAFDVLAETGADDFTMSRLAGRLGVQTPALYNHVRDRRTLVNLMRRQTGARIEAHHFDSMPWYEAIIPWAYSYRQAIATNPYLIALLAVVAIDGTESSVTGYESIVKSFLRGGWPLPKIVRAIVALENFIIGSSLDVLAEADNLAPSGNEDLAPTFVEALEAQRATTDVSPADAAFQFGLRVLIKGLRSEVARSAEP